MSLRLTVEGSAYEGWTHAVIDRGLRRFAHSFQLQYVDQWSEDQQPWPLRGGAPCVLSWAGQVLIDGYVLRPQWKVSGETLRLSAVGASRTIDLVQCSAVYKSGHWKDSTATTIAKDICAPFGISVTTGVGVLDTERYARFALQEGAKAFAEIDRVCKTRGLLPRTLPGGDVELFSPSAPAPVLALDVDAADGRDYEDDTSERYSDYLTRATGVGDPDDASAKAAARDSSIDRFRPLVILADAQAVKVKQAEQRAIYEANVRAGRGERLSYAFRSPLNAAGRLYAPGQRYRVRDDYFGIDRELLLDRAVLTVSADAVEQRIELVRPETYSQSEFTRERMVKKSARRKRRRGGANPFL